MQKKTVIALLLLSLFLVPTSQVKAADPVPPYDSGVYFATCGIGETASIFIEYSEDPNVPWLIKVTRDGEVFDRYLLDTYDMWGLQVVLVVDGKVNVGLIAPSGYTGVVHFPHEWDEESKDLILNGMWYSAFVLECGEEYNRYYWSDTNFSVVPDGSERIEW